MGISFRHQFDLRSSPHTTWRERLVVVTEQQSVVGRARVEILDPTAIALLLDVDGTLLNFALKPTDVLVEPALQRALARLVVQTKGAVALVSGRQIADIDRLFAPLVLPAVGVHGAEMRLAGADASIQRQSDPLDVKLRERLAKIADIDPGILFEDKGFSCAIHYRLAPQRARMIADLVAAICADFPLAATDILPGHSVMEIKRPAFDKGSGVRELMKHPPFAGRRPVFIGDDVTDEFAFAVMPDFKGFGFSVGREIAGLAGSFEGPADVRRWLYRLAARGDKPADSETMPG